MLDGEPHSLSPEASCYVLVNWKLIIGQVTMIGVIQELDASIMVTSAGGSFHTTGHWSYSRGMVCDAVMGTDEPRLTKALSWLFSCVGT